MAQTDSIITVAKTDVAGRTYWMASMYTNTADPTGGLIIKAAPTTGNLYLEHLTIQGDVSSAVVTILDGSNSLFGPFKLVINEFGGFIIIPLLRPIKLTDALGVSATVNGDFTILAQGFSQ